MWRTVEKRSHHTSRITYLISIDLILSELSDCEATQFAVAATNQNAVRASHVKADSESSGDRVVTSRRQNRHRMSLF